MNDYWEELNMSSNLKKAHDEEVIKMGIPEWTRFDCPFCNEKLSPRSIRNISLCLNARNIGDIAVEFCCYECQKMDTIYFRKAVNDLNGFAKMVDWDSYGQSPRIAPLLEEKMYALQYNNLLEKMYFDKDTEENTQ